MVFKNCKISDVVFQFDSGNTPATITFINCVFSNSNISFTSDSGTVKDLNIND